MKEYTVVCDVTISLAKTIEASSEAEAIEKAWELGVPTLCYQCGNARHEDTWDIGEVDGEPKDVRVSE